MIAIITGASGGIGKSLVEAFVNKDCHVIAIDKIHHKFNSDNVSFYQVDLQNPEDIQQAFIDIKKHLNTAHILINNAGISDLYTSLTDLSLEHIDTVLNVNLKAMILCSQEFIKLNQGQDYGRIINIASTRWNQNEPHADIYGASKGGVVAFSSSLCVSLSNTPITVNAISPGWIHVDDDYTLTEQDHKQHPSRRVGKPEDIARVCLFLSEKDNDFINGANILVDGGMTKKMIYT